MSRYGFTPMQSIVEDPKEEKIQDASARALQIAHEVEKRLEIIENNFQLRNKTGETSICQKLKSFINYLFQNDLNEFAKW